MPFDPPTIVLDPPYSHDLRDDLVNLWFDVSQKGGAIGYTPETPMEEVAGGVDNYLARMRGGLVHLLIASREDELVASCALLENQISLQSHFMELKRFMVHPKFQGTGLGTWMADQASLIAREEFQLDALHITVRSGLALDRFWSRCQFDEVAIIPRTVKLEDGSYRDSIYMQRALAGA
jgi:GNAT superfamily N-acetyltransferase